MLTLIKRIRNGNGIGAIFARGAARSFMAKTLGLAIGFILQITMARILGIGQYGIYVFALSWINVLLFVTVLGWDKTILRFIPVYFNDREYGKSNGLLRRSLLVVSASGTLVCVAMLAYLQLLGKGMDSAQTHTMMIAALLLPVLALSQLRQAGLNAVKQVFRSELTDTFIRPAIIIAAVLTIAIARAEPMQAHEAMWIQLTAAIVAFFIGARWLFNAIPPVVRHAAPTYDWRTWFGMAIPMLLVAGIQTFLKQTDVIMLGILQDTTAAGIYSVMVRLSDLAMFGLLAANAMAAPMIAELYASGKRAELERVVQLAVRGSLAFMVLASIGLVLFGKAIVSLYGEGFESGLVALYILLAGQIINASTGPVGFVVSMTGHQNKLALVQAVCAVLNIVLNALLIPRYGMQGAAIATATAMVCWKIWLLIFIRRAIGIRISPFM